jgi:hypothetical protein
MKIFLSWAGSESQQLAIIFKEWLGMLIQSSKPWLSLDIDKGAGWDGEIHNGLNGTKIGILFLTSESIESKYLHYEAGAISNVEDALVCTFLYGINKADVKQPLSRFQATEYTKSDVRKMVLTIFSKIAKNNPEAGTEVAILNLFDVVWADLEEKIIRVKNDNPSGEKIKRRTERDILEEILNDVRHLRSNASTRTSTPLPKRSQTNDVSDFNQSLTTKNIIALLDWMLATGRMLGEELDDANNVRSVFNRYYPNAKYSSTDMYSAISTLKNLSSPANDGFVGDN